MNYTGNGFLSSVQAMVEIRNRGSVLATEEGIQILKRAMARKQNHEGKIWKYKDIYFESGVSVKTIGHFFRGKKSVDESSARSICQALEVEFQDIVEICHPSQVPCDPQEPELRWRETCQELLNQWKGLTTNVLTISNGVRFQLDEMFVPLGVVERRQKTRHHSDGGSPEQGSELYEESVTPISQNAFFEQVLRQGQSKNSQGKRVAIIGEPGAGKTTQLQKIGDWILRETDGIPIWIPLAALGTRSLKEYLLNQWLQTATSELEISQSDRDELGQLLKTGRVWLLLDAVDEMSVSDALHQIATQMNERWLRNVRVVLTCRLNVWDAGKNVLDRFDVYRNLDFEYPGEVRQFIDRWFATAPELQEKLKLALKKPGKERICDMVKNPLRLTLLCHSWQLQQGELPETKADLYEWFVDVFYEWNKGKVSVKLNSTQRNELNRALGELAKTAIDQQSSRFRLPEKLVRQFLGDADDECSLFSLALELGWLNRIGIAEENPLENVYAFFHPTFQEYFAALSVNSWSFFLNHNNCVPNPHALWNGKKCIYRIFEEQWREVILLWIGNDSRTSEKEEFITALIEFEDGCENLYYDEAYLLAACCVIELPKSERTDEILENFIWLSCWFGGEAEAKKKNSKFKTSPDEAEKLLKRAEPQKLINVLLKLLEIIDDNEDLTNEISLYKKLRLIELLSEITIENQKVIEAINDVVIEAINDVVKQIRLHPACNPFIIVPPLEKISVRYPEPLYALVDICKKDDSSMKSMVLGSLLSNERVSSVEELVNRLNSCTNIWLKIELLKGLYGRSPSHANFFDTLNHLLLYSTSDLFYELEWFLEKEDVVQHPRITKTLLERLHSKNEEDIDVHDFCALSLGAAQVDDGKVISELFKMLNDGCDECNSLEAAQALFKLGKISESDFSDTLFRLLYESREGLALSRTAEALSEIHPENWAIGDVLINRMLEPDWKDEIEWFFLSIKKVFTGKLLPRAVTTLRHALMSTADYDLHEYIQLLLHHCARNMSYSDFYQAWQLPFNS